MSKNCFNLWKNRAILPVKIGWSLTLSALFWSNFFKWALLKPVHSWLIIKIWVFRSTLKGIFSKNLPIPAIWSTKYRRKVLVGSVAEDLQRNHSKEALRKASWTEKSTLEWSSVESFVLCRNMRRCYQRGNRTICGDAKGEISQWEYSDIDSKRLLHRRQYDLAIQDWRYQIQVASTNWRGCQEANHSEIWI